MLFACAAIILAGVAVLCIAARAGQLDQSKPPQDRRQTHKAEARGSQSATLATLAI